MVEIIVKYKITNNGDESINHFRLRVLPELAENGAVTGTTGVYATSSSPTKQASFSLAAGFERFFTLSDFGYSDQEVTTMHSILIQVPDASHGVLMLGPGDFVAEGTSVLSDDSYVDIQSQLMILNCRISYGDIVDGKFFFAPARCCRSYFNQFKVTDSIQSTNDSGDIEFNPGLDSFDTGLIELTITGAPKSR